MNTQKGALSAIAKAWLIVLGAVLVLAGLFFAIGGGKLAMLGGSLYFVLSGIAIVISGGLVLMRKPAGALLFGLVTVATAIWAVWEAGFDFWPLVSRLLAFGVGATVIALSYPLLRKAQGLAPAYLPSFAIAVIMAIASVAGFSGMFVPHSTIAATGTPVAPTPVSGQTPTNWEHYGNTTGGSRFVAADQIKPENVKDLKVAWTYRTGDVPDSPGGNGAEDQLTPLQVGNRVYVCTPKNNVIALDADSGKEIWKRDTGINEEGWIRCRGLAYFDATRPLVQPTIDGSTPVTPVTVAGALCQRRILMNTISAELIAIDADTGEYCTDFGNNGRVNLKEGLGSGADTGEYSLTSAPTLAGTTVVVGGRVGDNVALDMPGGVIRGFDVVTGQMRWAFDPGNPERKSAPEAGQTYARSTPNVWAPMSYDPQSNTVYMPVGSAAIDLWGVKRTALDRKYGATMLAVDATTGYEKWNYQTTHSDIWDYDVPMQPSLIDFPKADGSKVAALVFGTKAGQIFVLDRQTGQPLTEVTNKEFAPGTVPDEVYSPTQPISTGMPQIGADDLTEADMWGMTPFDQLLCRIDFKSMRYDGLYTPPGETPSLNLPGSLGGLNWGGISVDPNSNYIFLNDMRLGLKVELMPQTPAEAGERSTGGEAATIEGSPLVGTPYSIRAKLRFVSPLGVPCQEPPFGTMTAVDMKTQKIAWQIPLGTVEDTGPMGFKMGMSIPIGMPTIGGSLATQGGLVFFAATQDYYLRAFNSATGEEAWKARMPVGSQGTPISYVSPETGKQYIVVSAGGARNSPDRGDYVIAYSLPN